MFISTPSRTQAILERFRQVRAQTEKICAPLKPEDTVVQPVVDVSPPKWHMGHTTWFFEQFVLQEYVAGYEPFHPRYAYLFNSYYEGAGERVQRFYRGNMTRPGVDEILAYRHHVNQHMEAFLGDGVEKSAEWLSVIELGLQHEQQHQELLLYDIKYILGHNPLFPAYQEEKPAQAVQTGNAPSHDWLAVEAGTYEIGFAGEGFHFDNEEGRHRVFLEGYQVMDRLVTHGEFLEFVEAGGYQDYRYWLQEGIAWVKENGIDAPFYWFKLENGWHQVTLHGLQPIDMADST
ncbi:MAG: DinB family protein, partial [Bacteroidota bacterium]